MITEGNATKVGNVSILKKYFIIVKSEFTSNFPVKTLNQKLTNTALTPIAFHAVVLLSAYNTHSCIVLQPAGFANKGVP